MHSEVDKCTVKLTALGQHCTIKKDVALGGAKFRIEISIMSATSKKEMAEVEKSRKGLGPVIPPYQLKNAEPA